MALEIERKFLVDGEDWKAAARDEARIEQFYLFVREGCSMRVRIKDGRSAFLTIKTGAGLVREEMEYEIPAEDALKLKECRTGAVIEKVRHLVSSGRHVVEVDVFSGMLAGLVIAEIELESEGDDFERPAFLGREVTDDPRYTNARLAFGGLPAEGAPTADALEP